MNWLIKCITLASVVSLGYALTCYTCQTMAAAECNEPFNRDKNEGNTADCDPGTVCTKYKTIVKIRDSGYIQGWERHSIVVTRLCEKPVGKKDGCFGWQNNGGITQKCYCSTDLCNSARSVFPSLSIIFVSCLASLFVLVFLRQH
ncbi:uncharacterized protein LOC131940726 [Physella acuta]|uniref:uncharacterized protein LOC131940726 n=1 Tax=Physella acuta TaxID=109671 RepID=UPI0027DD5AD9|nr:uncharacterized protein LOC131940726 [Physella acuta]